MLKVDTIKSQLLTDSKTLQELKSSRRCVSSLRSFRGLQLQESRVPARPPTRLSKYDALIRRS